MPRQRSPKRDEAFELYKKSNGKVKLKDIAAQLEIKDSQVRKWKSQDKWESKLKGALPKTKSNVTKQKRKRGGQEGNTNAVGNSGGDGGPPGNINAIKHGVYQTLYADQLTEDEKELFEKTTADVSIDEEIRLLRLKIARLLNRKRSFFYDMFGEKHDKDITEEEREVGILAAMDQLRRLIETKARIANDTEEFELQKQKFDFQKYRTKIELQLKKEKLELEKQKLDIDGKDKTLKVTIVDDITEDDEDATSS